MTFQQSQSARRRWAKPGAREAQSEKIAEAMKFVPPREPAQGRMYGNRRGITVYTDPAMFDALRAMAKRRRKSMAEMIRTYIEWGLETDEAGDK